MDVPAFPLGTALRRSFWKEEGSDVADVLAGDVLPSRAACVHWGGQT